MPCSTGMRGCHAACQHRAMVLGYRDARDAYEAVLEQETSLYPAEVEEYKREVDPGIAFKQWLEGYWQQP